MGKTRRSYKDSVFCDIFRPKERLQEIYKGLSGRSVCLEEIRLTTLRGTFFNEVKNDVSFLAEKRHIVLLEHQSTWNENMPLRMFWYAARLYKNLVHKDVPYRRRRIALPAPEFYVLYNGLDPAPDEWEMRLSDAFGEEAGNLELRVKAYNINDAPGRVLLERCRSLKGYSVFVAQVRKLTEQGECLEQAVMSAIRYCIEQDYLADYFREREHEEVFDMVSFKWDPERAHRVQLEEEREIAMEQGLERGLEQGLEQGLERGAENARQEFVLSMLKEKMPTETIARLSKVPMEKVLSLGKMHRLL